MGKHSHDFVETYKGFVGFGLDRQSDENTVIYCLQKFSDDQCMECLRTRLSNNDLEDVFNLITKIVTKHLSEQEYHQVYLKDD